MFKCVYARRGLLAGLETVVGAQDGIFDARAEIGDGGCGAAGEVASEDYDGVVVVLLGKFNYGGIGVGRPEIAFWIPGPADFVVDFRLV